MQKTVITSVIGTSITDHAIDSPYQRKTCSAANLFWVFYSDGVDIVYRTSQDGISWSDATIIKLGGTIGYYFSIWVEGTDFIYAYRKYLGSPNYQRCQFTRRGTLNSNGTITWSFDEQATNLDSYRLDTSITKDSAGYFWMAWGHDWSNPWIDVQKSVDTVPTGWGTRVTFTGLTNNCAPLILPLLNGRVYIIFNRNDGLLQGKLYNGSAWQATVTIGSIPTEAGGFRGFGAVSNNGVLHLVYLDSNNDIVYQNFDGVTWGSPLILQSDVSSSSYPVLAINPTNGNLYVFWAQNNHIYYKRCIGGVWDANPSDCVTEDSLTNNTLTIFYIAESKVGLAYLTNLASPYTVKFAYVLLG